MSAVAVAVHDPTESTPAPFLVQRVKDYIGQSRAASTLRGYRSDVADFTGFCQEHSLCQMPATVERVCYYLSAVADSGLSAGSVSRRVSAIAAAHTSAGFDSPTTKAAVKLCLAGIRRALGVRQVGKAPTLTGDIAAMLSHVPAGLLGVRDRAMLLVGFAGAFRRSELVALEVEDLQFTEDGVKILIRKSKTDQEGAGQTVAIARGVKTCPVEALKVWLEASGITSGPIFRSVNRHGHLQQGAVTDQVVALVVKRYAVAAGLDPRQYAGHSLRAGLVTQAAINGVSELAIMKTTRHKSSAMVQRYIRDANLFRDNASGRVGL